MNASASAVGPVPAPGRTAPSPGPGWVTWAGLAVVLTAAAVLSFDALRGLAGAVAIPSRFAWLLPVAVDAGAAVSCATWLGGRTPVEAARFAGRMTWALLAVTVAGNAGQLGMHAHQIAPPWWVAVIVGTIPPAVVGATVHLVVLLTRTTGPVDRPDRSTPDRADQETGPVLEPGVPTPPALPVGPAADHSGTAQTGAEPTGADTPVDLPRTGQSARSDHPDREVDPLLPDVARWVADQTGPPSGRQLRSEFGIGADRARRLLAEVAS